MSAARVRLGAITTSFVALSMVTPRTSHAQEVEHRLAIDARAGYGLIAGGAGQVMRPPGLVMGTLRYRLTTVSPWWIGLDINEVRAPSTRAGMDTLVAHAGYLEPGERRGYYRLASVGLSLRYELQTKGALRPFGVGSIGWGSSTGMICVSYCRQSEGPLDGHQEYRPATTIGGGIAIRLPELSPQLKRIPVKLSAEMRLVSIGTNHGNMVSAPLLIGISL